MDSDSIKEKIKKLLSLADSTSEHEAEIAMKRANELMKKYSIDEMSVRGMPNETDIEGIEFHLNGTQQWDSSLYYAIAKAFSCTCFQYNRSGGKRRVKIYGTSKNRMVVSMIYDYAIKTLENIYIKAKKDYIKKYKVNTSRSFTHSFKKGVAYGMCDALKKIEEANKKDIETSYGGISFALVFQNSSQLSRKKMYDENPRLKKSTANVSITNSNAYRDGFEKGKNVSFNNQVKSGSSVKYLS